VEYRFAAYCIVTHRFAAHSLASDVASQGGGAGPGRDRHRLARSAVRAGWRGGPSPGTASGHRSEARRPRTAGPRRPRLRGKGIAHPRIIWEFHWRISGSSAAGQSSGRAASAGGESPERIGQSRAATRPQPAELRQVYQTWPGATRIPERSGARANRTSVRAASDTRGRQGPGGRSDHRAIVGN
jgi:hypothetical protein